MSIIIDVDATLSLATGSQVNVKLLLLFAFTRVHFNSRDV